MLVWHQSCAASTVCIVGRSVIARKLVHQLAYNLIRGMVQFGLCLEEPCFDQECMGTTFSCLLGLLQAVAAVRYGIAYTSGNVSIEASAPDPH